MMLLAPEVGSPAKTFQCGPSGQCTFRNRRLCCAKTFYFAVTSGTASSRNWTILAYLLLPLQFTGSFHTM